MRSADPAFTGQVVGIRRNPEAAAEGRYEAELFAGPASEFANFVKRFPAEWILPNYQALRRKRSRTSGRSSKASRNSS